MVSRLFWYISLSIETALWLIEIELSFFEQTVTRYRPRKDYVLQERANVAARIYVNPLSFGH